MPRRSPSSGGRGAAPLLSGLALLFLLLTGGRAEENLSSADHRIPRSAVSAGGGASSSANLRLESTMGEEVAASTTAPAGLVLGAGARHVFAFPGTVTNLTGVEGAFLSSTTLQWTAPGYDGGVGSLRPGSTYFIRIASFTSPNTFVSTSAQIALSTSATAPGLAVSTPVFGLLPNTTWFAQLWTLDAAGNRSYASERATFTTLALPVSDAHPGADPFMLDELAEISGVFFTSVTVRWAALPTKPPHVDSMTAAGYVVEASSTDFGVLKPGGEISSSFTYRVEASTLIVFDPPLGSGKQYFFRVGSLNHAGAAHYRHFGSTTTNLMAVIPAAADPAFTDVSSGSLVVRWDSNGNADRTSYRIQIATKAGFATEIFSSNDVYETFLATSVLLPNTTYFFQVRASTKVSTSLYFQIGSTVTLTMAPGGPPVGISTFSGVDTDRLSVSWYANGNPLDLTTYSVVASTSEGWPNSSEDNIYLSTPPVGALPSATLTGLEPNTTYYLFAAGVNHGGVSSDYHSLGSTVTRAVAPLANPPTFDELASDGFWVRWNAGLNPVERTTYTLEASTSSLFNADPAYQASLGTVPFGPLATFTGLLANATYHVRVRAVDHGGLYTAYADLGSTSTLANPPGTVGFDLIAPAETSLTLAWGSNGNANEAWVGHTTYTVTVSTDENFGYGAYVTTHTTTDLFLSTSGLSVNTTYYFRARAKNHNGVPTAYVYAATSTLVDTPLVSAPPTFLSVDRSSLTVRWNGGRNLLALTTYTVQASASQSFSPLELDQVTFSTMPAAGPAVSFSGLSADTTYYVRVQAYNHNSVPTDWTVLGETATLAALPTSPDVTELYLSSMVVTWTGVAASGYELKGSSTNIFTGLNGVVSMSSSASGGTSSLLLDAPRLEPNATYYLRLSALNHNSVPSVMEVSSHATLAYHPSSASYYAGLFTGVFATSVTVTWAPLPSAAVAGASRSAEGYVLEATTADVYGVTDWTGDILSSATLGFVVSNRVVPSTLTIDNLLSGTTYVFRVGSLNWAGATNYMVMSATRTREDPYTWTGVTSNNWYTATNWSPNGVPGTGSPVTIAVAGANVYVAPNSPPINFSSMTIGKADGSVVASLTLATTVARGGSILLNKGGGLTLATTREIYLDGDFTMIQGSSLTHRSLAVTVSSVNVRVTGLFDLQAGATVTVSSAGFAGGVTNGGTGGGPGGGGGSSASSGGGSGGGHGGGGGQADSNSPGVVNDSREDPQWCGSGGGGGDFSLAYNVGGRGGGAVIIQADTLQLDGLIEADGEKGGPGNGTAARAGGGGGSGGTVNLKANYLIGSGTITAVGGAGGADSNGGIEPGAGGGGGRVAVNIQNSGNLCAIRVSTAGGPTGGGSSSDGNGGTYSSTVTLKVPGFEALYSSATDIHWNWTLVTGGTAYQIMSSTGGLGQSPVFGSGTTSYTETSLQPNTTYTRRIELFTCGGSTGSAFVSYATLARAPGLPPTPIVDVFLSSMTVGWYAEQNAQGYVLEASSTDFASGTVYSSQTYSALASTLTVVGLAPNTTYFLRVASLNHASVKSTYTVLGATSSRTFAPPSLGAETFFDEAGVSTVYHTSITVNWGRLPTTAEQGEANTCEGYVVEASETDFGGGTVYSSASYVVWSSTLTVGAAPGPALDRCKLYAFRVASLNWNGAPGPYTPLGSTSTTQDWGANFTVHSIDLGNIPVGSEYVVPTGFVVTNGVACPATFNLKAEVTTFGGSPWSVDSSSGTDTLTVQAVFDPGPGAPSAETFTEDDLLGGTSLPATPVRFAAGETGENVAYGGTRTLWLKIGMPRISSVDTAQELKVTVYGYPP